MNKHSPSNRAAASRPGQSKSRPASRGRRLRLLGFGILSAAIALAALGLVAARLLPSSPLSADAIQVKASMGGFSPDSFSVKAGSTVSIELTSLDTQFHSDGGGWHEMAIDQLGIDWKVGPESSKVFEFTAPATPGTYTWYCGICCGGRANPTMQGKLTVTA